VRTPHRSAGYPSETPRVYGTVLLSFINSSKNTVIYYPLHRPSADAHDLFKSISHYRLLSNTITQPRTHRNVIYLFQPTTTKTIKLGFVLVSKRKTISLSRERKPQRLIASLYNVPT
jgi:hypothetical protein